MEQKYSKSKKITAVAASVTALYSFSGLANAALLTGSGGPTINTGSGDGFTVDWDVDGVGGIDFTFSVKTFKANTSSSVYSSAQIKGQAASGNYFFDDLLASGASLNTTIPVSGKTFAVYSNIIINTTATSTVIVNNNGGFYGFSFLNAANTDLFGWVDIGVTIDGFNNTSLTINSWCYDDSGSVDNLAVNSCDNTSVSVPEPSVPSLLLIGLGAAGVRKWRMQKGMRD